MRFELLPLRLVVGCIAALLCSLLLLTTPLPAQVVQGTVLESGTRTPITAVEVVLHDAVGERAARGQVVTDTLGVFRLAAPLPGRYTLQLRRIGYATQTTNEFEVVDGEVVVLEVTMSTQSIKLDSLVVVERRRTESSMIRSFRERAEWTRKTGRGRVYYADELRGIGNVRSLYMLNSSSRGCPMTVLVDNLPISDPRELDFLGDAERVEGVEIYRSPHQIPEEFQHHKSCALMLVWTKQSGGNPFSWKRLVIGTALVATLFLLNW